MEKSSPANSRFESVYSSFSDDPVVHYLLTICIFALLPSALIGWGAYDCFVMGTPDACGYPEELGNPDLQTSPSTFVPSKFALAMLIACFSYVASFFAFFISSLPLYWIAFRLSKRWHVGRNVVGVIFWIAAWVIATSILPLCLAIAEMFHPNRVDWRAILSLSGAFAIIGIICGIIYCLLALVRRAVISAD
jgi:small-conductance mechanosensitive channel